MKIVTVTDTTINIALHKKITYSIFGIILLATSFKYLLWVNSHYPNVYLKYAVEVFVLILCYAIGEIFIKPKLNLMTPMIASIVIAAFFVDKAYLSSHFPAIEHTIGDLILYYTYALHPIVIGVVVTGLLALVTKKKV